MPIHKMQDILDNLGGQKCFSTRDMSRANHKGFMDKDSRHFTAFTSLWGLIRMVKNTLWTTESTSCVSNIYERVFRRTKRTLRFHPYLDDILCYGKTFDEHMENLKRVLWRLKKIGVKVIKAGKCIFFKKQIKYFGKIASENGYRYSTINTKALEKL